MADLGAQQQSHLMVSLEYLWNQYLTNQRKGSRRRQEETEPILYADYFICETAYRHSHEQKTKIRLIKNKKWDGNGNRQIKNINCKTGKPESNIETKQYLTNTYKKAGQKVRSKHPAFKLTNAANKPVNYCCISQRPCICTL